MNILDRPTTVNDFDVDGGLDGPDPAKAATIGTLLNFLLHAVDNAGLEIVPGSLSEYGFSIHFQGTQLRIGFGVTTANDVPRSDWPTV